ncbi:unnamed protein product [Adineta ricciae]|uniref:Uncharacterized protein n=1 Tax=Adineta ricciae TaxID=249248 RepID=A0A814SX85_ADIRI|nr:unnamed protein product [Adineta ricciae]CAF1473759.1 unnamed protein product [Adineta ricciae]
MFNHISQFYQNTKSYIQNFNLFPSIPPSTDQHQLQNEKISTRIFIILPILSLTILLLYTSLINVTQTININTPTILTYQELHSKYSQVLTCPCTQISMSYDTFHQFYSNQFISASVISSELFQLQVESLVNQFISSTTNDFLLSLTTIRNTTQSNGIFTGPLTNYAFVTYENEDYTPLFARTYRGCDCGLSASCNFPSYIRAYETETTLFVIPGFYSACYTIESLLQSDLQCFYDQTCIDELQFWFLSRAQRNITSLDSSMTSRFSLNSTFEEILSDLMVEKWNSTLMYEKYYYVCMPTECTYTRQAKNNAIYIVTTLFGLTGGLTKAFRLVVPFLVKYTILFIQKWKRKNAAILPMIEM